MLTCVGWFGIGLAEQKDAPPPKRESQRAAAAPVYKPPLRGAPGGRVGGGTRGTQERDIFVLSVLAPDHTGLTTHEQPSLFWVISTPTTLPVELTIVDPKAVEPLLQIRIPSPVERGVHRLRLADHGIRLARGVAYQWSVTVVPDLARRSRDILSSGMIQRVDEDPELASKRSSADAEDLVAVYAQAGIWYDALETVCDLIERSPGDATLRSNRAALLRQAELPEIPQ
jgi:uncharacterized protein DUF928